MTQKLLLLVQRGLSSQMPRALPLSPLPPCCVTLFLLYPHDNGTCPDTEDKCQLTQACGTWQMTCCFVSLCFPFGPLLCVELLKALMPFGFYSFLYVLCFCFESRVPTFVLFVILRFSKGAFWGHSPPSGENMGFKPHFLTS